MKISLSNNEKLNLISNLGTMLTAGIPIMDALTFLIEEEKGNAKKVLELLKTDLGQGKTIAASFEKNPKAFDVVTVSLIKAAEESGTLDETLKDITKNIKKEIEFNEKVKTAFTYPVLVLIVFTAVLFLLFSFVIPRISLVFSRLNITLPIPTKILIETSRIFNAYLPFIIVGLVFLILGLYFFYKTHKKTLLNLLYRLPVMSQLARDIDITRFSRSLALLLSSGIPIAEALELTSQVVTRKNIYEALVLSQSKVVSGKDLSEGLKSTKKVFPTLVISIIQAGEKSGTLEKSTQEIADHFDEQVSNRLKVLTTLIEPVLLVVIGLFVGGIMLAVMAPIYGLIGQLGTR